MKAVILNIINKLEMEEAFISLIDSLTFVKEDFNPFSEEKIGIETLLLDEKRNLELALGELINLEQYYKERNISEFIFIDTLSDFKFRIKRFKNTHGFYGLSAHDMKWLGYIFRAETFKIHNLKFRKYPLTYAEIERGGHDYLPLSKDVKKNFYEGLPVVYVHIAAQTDLSDESVTRSFKLADQFFSSHFSEYEFQYYICRTWMLYPGLLNIMNEESNIIKFQKRFDIIGTHDNPDQSLSRIYNTTKIKEIETMEKKSSLMKTAYLNVNHLGVGVGVINRSELEEGIIWQEV